MASSDELAFTLHFRFSKLLMLFLYYLIGLVVQWIVRGSPEPKIPVRFWARPPNE